MSYTNDIMGDDCMLTASAFDVNNKKVLIASRHMRNDSKGIQLEIRLVKLKCPFLFQRFNLNFVASPPSYDSYADKPENIKIRKHIRSNSCDVKIDRSNSREYDIDYRNRRIHNNNRSHSRNNSRDIDMDLRIPKRMQTHSRTNSRDEPINIKYILNCLKPDYTNKLFMSSTAMTSGEPKTVKKHSRNHSYDQIYNMPNNIKIDQELHNKFNKNRNKSTVIENDLNLLQNNANITKEYLDNKFSNIGDGLTKAVAHGSHSRTNSKDLNKSSFLVSMVDDATNNILRHRRTNSKDLNRIVNAMPSTSSEANTSGLHQSHIRNLSQTKIDDFPNDNSDVRAQVLLLRNNENRDNINDDIQNIE